MQVNIHEAKTHLSRLLERAAAGEEIVIARAGKPVATLVAFKSSGAGRTPGSWRGRVVIHEDFDELPSEITAAFAGRAP